MKQPYTQLQLHQDQSRVEVPANPLRVFSMNPDSEGIVFECAFIGGACLLVQLGIVELDVSSPDELMGQIIDNYKQ